MSANQNKTIFVVDPNKYKFQPKICFFFNFQAKLFNIIKWKFFNGRALPVLSFFPGTYSNKI
jgi:hypothetical protein